MGRVDVSFFYHVSVVTPNINADSVHSGGVLCRSSDPVSRQFASDSRAHWVRVHLWIGDRPQPLTLLWCANIVASDVS